MLGEVRLYDVYLLTMHFAFTSFNFLHWFRRTRDLCYSIARWGHSSTCWQDLQTDINGGNGEPKVNKFIDCIKSIVKNQYTAHHYFSHLLPDPS